ncbi:DEAD/DEAH box helicase [Evansella cellulosilytica]|uniref:Helicase domain protein n=1 Tax=Evansella cellulosilytica (strain ATCC 21833 / DSM 2522 / FERM P-1141 / JCM 9156 / N-4) TaxID=649639 RepID=E6U0Z0_EVAC2|nr:DEAD/DEAH box helicase [Evansella cellulosilytica]ADU30302.1 helicase domain protein [Evansella cellulosilytica DSM 2522]
MDKLMSIVDETILITKKKVTDDIYVVIGEYDTCPSLHTYLTERRKYLEQIWTNVFINKATNELSKKQKKQILIDKGYDVESIPRKQMNQLFRSIMKEYADFDVVHWLNNEYEHHPLSWEELYHTAREEYIKREEAKRYMELRDEVFAQLNDGTSMIIDEKKDDIYIFVRYHLGKQLRKDLIGDSNESIDSLELQKQITKKWNFQKPIEVTYEDFLVELFSVQHAKSYGTYEYVYDQVVLDCIFSILPNMLLKQLPENTVALYYQLFYEKLNEEDLKALLGEKVYVLASEMELRIKNELLIDLLSSANISFDFDMQRKLYLQQTEVKEKKLQLAKEEELRLKEAEEQMIEDIFGREYRPPLGRNIRYVLHIGETNTGKTFQALKSMSEAKSGLYLAPLRLLALEVYDKLNGEGVPCSLKTGEEEKEVDNANHYSCTVEMFHEKEYFDVIVIDEAQMIADKDRGFSWYKAITKANANEVHIIGSVNSKEMILQLLGDSNVVIHEYERDIPLQVEKKEFNLKQTKKGDALVCFSRRRVLETASNLENNGHRVSMVYGSMPPETRKKQMKLFIDGKTTVIVSTDAIGMGLNLPIRRIVFLENDKFDGTRRRRLSSQEVKQIAGRAGRKGIYDVGKVAFTKEIKLMKRLLNQQDFPVQTFAIAPTNNVFERFQHYSRDLGKFFELWDKFRSPKGTKKAALTEEKALYELISGTEIEARFSMMDLYGFLHLPFSTREPSLTEQWQETMQAIIDGASLPEPIIKKGSLEQLELSYKSIGLHLLFLYRLEKRTEAIYWERVREELSDDVHVSLRNDVKKFAKKCKRCGKVLPYDFSYPICSKCFSLKYRKKKKNIYYD